VFTVPAVLERPSAIPGSSLGFAAPGLRQPRSDEITIGLSHRLPGEVTADAAFIGRGYRDRIVSIDTNGIYEDGRFLGYREPAFNQIHEIRNGSANWLVYRSLELSLHRAAARGLQFLIAYSYSRQWIDGTWDQNDPAGFLQPDAFPNGKGVGSIVALRHDQINSFALNEINTGVPPHMLKANITYLAPLGFAIGVSHLFQMGQYSGPVLTLMPQASVTHPSRMTLLNGRTVSNPLATRLRFFYARRGDGQLQLPALNLLNVRIGKRFFRGSHAVEGALEIFNLLNQGNHLAFDTPTLAEGRPAAFGATYRQSPRAGLLTVRWAF
jgi:hypothetical protein